MQLPLIVWHCGLIPKCLRFSHPASEHSALSRWRRSQESRRCDPPPPLGAVRAAWAQYLGEEGSRAPITAAMTVGSPTDLLATSAHMSRPVQRHFYSRVLVHGLQNYFRRNEVCRPRVAGTGNWTLTWVIFPSNVAVLSGLSP